MKRRLIIIGLFWERFSAPHWFSRSSSISTPFPFSVDSCCHSYEALLLQLLWACMSVSVTNSVSECFCEWLRPSRLFCYELFKRPLPFERWVRVCFGWAFSSVCKCWCAFVCVCAYSMFQACTWQALSQMLEAAKGTLNWSARTGDFHKDRSQQVLLSSLALSHSSFMQLSPFGFWQC